MNILLTKLHREIKKKINAVLILSDSTLRILFHCLKYLSVLSYCVNLLIHI
jgi:hypothetical protein